LFIVSGDQTNHQGTTMESLPSELVSFIQQLRPLMRVEVFNSFCFLLMGVLIGEAKSVFEKSTGGFQTRFSDE
jgi:hypothetical protein